MRPSLVAVLLTAALLTPPTALWATSLQVTPVSVEVLAPGAAAVVKLRNDGTNAVEAQIRVFRWVQVNGEERLEPTEDVVASPPMATVKANADYTVRLVRVTKRPVARGEAYRLLIDELPDPTARRNGAVALVLRYSIPVFFYPRDAAEAALKWSVERRSGRVYVTATNDGERHVRLSALRLRTRSGASILFGDGLTGYVLGRSTMRWVAPGNTDRFDVGDSVVISAQADRGPINAAPASQPPR